MKNELVEPHIRVKGAPFGGQMYIRNHFTKYYNKSYGFLSEREMIDYDMEHYYIPAPEDANQIGNILLTNTGVVSFADYPVATAALVTSAEDSIGVAEYDKAIDGFFYYEGVDFDDEIVAVVVAREDTGKKSIWLSIKQRKYNIYALGLQDINVPGVISILPFKEEIDISVYKWVVGIGQSSISYVDGRILDLKPMKLYLVADDYYQNQILEKIPHLVLGEALGYETDTHSITYIATLKWNKVYARV